MGAHHPTEAREPFHLRLAPTERELLERGAAAYRRAFDSEATLSEWVRLVACEAAHRQVAAERRPPADPRQVDLEELLGTRKPTRPGADVEGFERFIETRGEELAAVPTSSSSGSSSSSRPPSGRRRSRDVARRAGPRRAARGAPKPRA